MANNEPLQYGVLQNFLAQLIQNYGVNPVSPNVSEESQSLPNELLQLKKEVAELKTVVYQLLLASPQSHISMQHLLWQANSRIPQQIIKTPAASNVRKRTEHQMNGEAASPLSQAGTANFPIMLETEESPSCSSFSPITPSADVSSIFPSPTQNYKIPRTKRSSKVSDDYVKLIKNDLSWQDVSQIKIPVPEALECDPSFEAVSEQAIVSLFQAEIDSGKEIRETAQKLCSRLAEKRVFGARLMAQTTVAGPNHSSYRNLPGEGIIYIQHVCREFLKDYVQNEEEFWAVFSQAMRRLAARCRRLRFGEKEKSEKKNREWKPEVAPFSSTNNPLSMLSQPLGDEWLELIRARADEVAEGLSETS